MTKLDYQFEGFAVGNNGEEDGATIEFTATVVDGSPIVDAESITVYAYGNNAASHLGYDSEADTEMQCPRDMMEQCNQFLYSL